jgi:hypothetical protein
MIIAYSSWEERGVSMHNDAVCIAKVNSIITKIVIHGDSVG